MYGSVPLPFVHPSCLKYVYDILYKLEVGTWKKIME